jgi:tetratricopeptide (TPR) repeat protein
VGLAGLAVFAIGLGYAFLLYQGAQLADLRRQHQVLLEKGDGSSLAEREILQRLVFLDARDSEAWNRLIQVHLLLNEPDLIPVAFARWEEAFETPPPLFYLSRANVAAQQNRLEEALADWQRYAQISPGAEPVLWQQAEGYARLGRWKEARDCYEAWGMSHSKLETALALANCDLHLRRWQEAIALIRPLAEQYADHSAIKAQWPRYERLERLLPEIQQQEELLRQTPTDWVAHSRLAILFWDHNLPDLVVFEAQQAGDVQPLAQTPRLLHGAALLQLGRPKEAATLQVFSSTLSSASLRFLLEADAGLLRPLVEAKPDRAALLTQRAALLEEADQFEAALHDAQSALNLDPGIVRANLIAARSFYRENQLTDALLHASAIVGTAPNDPAAWLLLGQIQQARADLDNALVSFSRALTLKTSPEALRARAQCLRQLGDPLRAAVDEKRLKDLKP